MPKMHENELEIDEELVCKLLKELSLPYYKNTNLTLTKLARQILANIL
jgi:hypothetical protein